MLATVERARPTRFETSSWLNPNSSISCRYASAVSSGIEILTLEVLDEGELQLLAIGELTDDRGDPFETGRLRRPETPFAGDELVAVEGLRDEDRLQDAMLRGCWRRGTRAARHRTAFGVGAGSDGSG